MYWIRLYYVAGAHDKAGGCVGADLIGLYDVIEVHDMTGGHVWGLIGWGCMVWQEHMI